MTFICQKLKVLIGVALIVSTSCTNTILIDDAFKKQEAATYYFKQNEYTKAKEVCEEAIREWEKLKDEHKPSIPTDNIDKYINECRNLIEQCNRYIGLVEKGVRKPKKYYIYFGESYEKRQGDIYPLKLTDSFSKGDGKRVCVFTDWYDLVPSTKYVVKWEWYDPNGHITNVISRELNPIKKIVKTVGWINLDHKFKWPSGTWSVKICMNDLYIDTVKFMLTGIDYHMEPPKDPILRLETGTHTAALWKMDIDAANRYLVTGSNDKTVRVWDLSSYRLLNTLRPPIGEGTECEIRAVAISPDGETIACGGLTGRSWDSSYSVYIFDRRSGEMVRRLTGFPGSIHHLVYSKDGRFLAVSYYKGVMVYRTPNYQVVENDTNYGDRCSRADFDLNGRLATGSYDGYIRLYDVSEKNVDLTKKKKSHPDTQITSLKFSPDGSRIAVAYLDDHESLHNVDIFSGEDLKYLYSPDMSGIMRTLSPVTWSIDGESLYAGGSVVAKATRRPFTPIYKWSDGGLGRRKTLRAAMVAIQDMCPLKRGGISFIAYDTAWGIFNSLDKRVYLKRPNKAAFVGQSRGFPISPDASKVLFSYMLRYNAPALFNIKEQSMKVLDTLSSQVDNLIWPLTELPGMSITDWRMTQHPKLNNKRLQLRKNEFSHCLAIAPDANSLVLGTEWGLYCFDRLGKRLWRIPVRSITRQVNISQDSRILVAAIADGTIRWYCMEDGKEILALFPHSDRKRWIAWIPEGYYMSSPYGDELIGWHINNVKDREADFYTAMQFERILYRPDYVREYFRSLGDLQKASQVLGEKPFDIKDLASIAPPRVEILSPGEGDKPPQDNIRLKITAKKCSLPMQSYTVFVNNIPVTPSAERALTGAEQDSFIREVEAPLFGHENRIRVEVFNGTSLGLAEEIVYGSGSAGRRTKGNLYLLSIGVNNFKHMPDNNLDYAALDAENIAKSLKKEEGDLFDNVFIRVVSDHSETKPLKENIIKNLEFLKKAQAEDTVIIFLASHGLSDLAGNYYFVPNDAKSKDLDKIFKDSERGFSSDPLKLPSLISWEAFFNTLSSIPGKRLLLVDTCQAKNISGTFDIHSLAKRSATASFALLAASQGDEQSQEYPEGRQGLFTYALLKALSGQGDTDKDGKIILSELYDFISGFVENNRDKKIGKQTPHLAAPKELEEMVLVAY